MEEEQSAPFWRRPCDWMLRMLPSASSKETNPSASASTNNAPTTTTRSDPLVTAPTPQQVTSSTPQQVTSSTPQQATPSTQQATSSTPQQMKDFTIGLTFEEELQLARQYSEDLHNEDMACYQGEFELASIRSNSPPISTHTPTAPPMESYAHSSRDNGFNPAYDSGERFYPNLNEESITSESCARLSRNVEPYNPEVVKTVKSQTNISEDLAVLTVEDLVELTVEKCKICCDAPLDCLLLKCNHVATCCECALRLKECPVCGKTILERKMIISI